MARITGKRLAMMKAARTQFVRVSQGLCRRQRGREGATMTSGSSRRNGIWGSVPRQAPTVALLG